MSENASYEEYEPKRLPWTTPIDSLHGAMFVAGHVVVTAWQNGERLLTPDAFMGSMEDAGVTPDMARDALALLETKGVITRSPFEDIIPTGLESLRKA